MSLASWLTRAGGWIAAPFTGGASLAVTEPIAQTIETKDAQKKIVQQQQQGTNQALAAYQPYIQTGAAAQNTLAGLMGLPTTPTANGQGGVFNYPIATGPASDIPRGLPTSGTLMPAMPTPSQASEAGQASAQARSSSYGGMVRLQAPDGTVELVPADQAEHFMSRGARRVN